VNISHIHSISSEKAFPADTRNYLPQISQIYEKIVSRRSRRFTQGISSSYQTLAQGYCWQTKAWRSWIARIYEKLFPADRADLRREFPVVSGHLPKGTVGRRRLGEVGSRRFTKNCFSQIYVELSPADHADLRRGYPATFSMKCHSPPTRGALTTLRASRSRSIEVSFINPGGTSAQICEICGRLFS